MLLGVILIWLLIRYLGDNADFYSALQSLNPLYLSLAFVLQGLVILLYALRTHLVVGRLASNPGKFMAWLKIYAIGRTLNIFALQSGDFFRAYSAKKNFGLEYANYGSAFLLAAWIDLILILFSAVVSRWAIVDSEIGEHIPTLSLVLILLTWILAAPVGSVILHLTTKLPKCPKAIGREIHRLLGGFWGSATDKRLMLILTTAALGSLVSMNLLVLLVFAGLGIEIEIYQAALLFAGYKLSQAVSITPGSIGIREFSIAYLCTLMGFDITQGLIFALLLRAINLIASASTAGVSWLWLRFAPTCFPGRVLESVD